MDVLEADYFEYQDANGLPLENALIHEYVQFHLKKNIDISNALSFVVWV